MMLGNELEETVCTSMLGVIMSWTASVEGREGRGMGLDRGAVMVVGWTKRDEMGIRGISVGLGVGETSAGGEELGGVMVGRIALVSVTTIVLGAALSTDVGSMSADGGGEELEVMAAVRERDWLSDHWAHIGDKH